MKKAIELAKRATAFHDKRHNHRPLPPATRASGSKLTGYLGLTPQALRFRLLRRLG